MAEKHKNRQGDMMKIGLYGIAFQSTNKGCEALAYSSLKILDGLALDFNTVFEVYIIQKLPTKFWVKNGFSNKKVEETICPLTEFKHLKIKYILPFHSKTRILCPLKISSLDFVLDFTEGDSFSDIYGRDRFFSDAGFKLSMIRKNVPYILGSQTIGPFNDNDIREQAALILNKCERVYVRDELSFQCVKETSQTEPVLTTDIAFLLPYDIQAADTSKIRIGFNPSGLLWQQRSANSKNIDLSVDYQRYCCEVLSFFLSQDNAEVYLIPHATSIKPNGMIEDDSDLVPCKELHDRFPEAIMVDVFKTAIDAKSLISSLDFFVGARMHATIAAISTGVPVVPFSYSRKFEGLFGSIDYPYIVHGTTDNTENAVRNTMDWYNARMEVKESALRSRSAAELKVNTFVDGLKSYIAELI